ncbi:hypothetical protein [Profundibacter sp.]|uniref:hypothetical protein n=1 Tax=Profundibacter sp. TaxID=3101071 RepID=UPI003D0BF87B
MAVSDHVVHHRNPQTDFQEAGCEGGDTIFSIDRLVEPLIVNTIKGWPNELMPIVVVAEGMGDTGVIVIGNPEERPRYRLLLDPIDGTRGLMYDKRSAWFLAAAAPNHGENTGLSDSFASVMVEIPNCKQFLADIWIGRREAATTGIRRNTLSDERYDIKCSPSSSKTLRNGFAQVSNFFPGTKSLASDLMEVIAERCGHQAIKGQSLIFDDQYISTGGQFVELMTGHDRFCCDLRPIFYEIIKRRTGKHPAIGLQCHPYDIAGLLAARNSGALITDAWGNELDAPFDVSTPIHWCGYANLAIKTLIFPVIQEWIATQLPK